MGTIVPGGIIRKQSEILKFKPKIWKNILFPYWGGGGGPGRTLTLNPGEQKFQGSKTSSQIRYMYNKGKNNHQFFIYGPQYKTRGLSAWQLRCLIVYATLMMSNCLWYSQINTQWSWFDLSMPPKVKCNGVNWKTIYDLLYVFHAKFDKKMLHLRDATFWKSYDLDLTLKGYPMSIVLR